MRTALSLLGILLVLLAGCGGGDSGPAGSGNVIKKAEACLDRSAESDFAAPSKPSRTGLKRLHLSLDGRPDAEDAGILLAAQRGYFADAGLDLEITAPVISSNLPGYLISGDADLVILPQPQVTMARAEGMPLVAFGSVVGSPTMALMSLKGSGVESVADLKGKTVAFNSLPFEVAVLKGVLADVGLTLKDVKLMRAEYETVQALLSRHADATIGVSPNVEGVELEACGLEPVVVPLQKLGVPPYEELDLVARRDLLVQDPGRFRAFVSAMRRGVAAAAEDPGEAAEAIARYGVETAGAYPQRPAVVEAKVEATLPLLSRSASMDPARADRFTAWMRRHGLIPHEVPISEVLTNRLVEQEDGGP